MGWKEYVPSFGKAALKRKSNKSKLNDRVRLPTAFPRGTIVHYNGIPCELLDDTPYYSATIEAAKECEEAHLPGDCPSVGQLNRNAKPPIETK